MFVNETVVGIEMMWVEMAIFLKSNVDIGVRRRIHLFLTPSLGFLLFVLSELRITRFDGVNIIAVKVIGNVDVSGIIVNELPFTEPTECSLAGIEGIAVNTAPILFRVDFLGILRDFLSGDFIVHPLVVLLLHLTIRRLSIVVSFESMVNLLCFR